MNEERLKAIASAVVVIVVNVAAICGETIAEDALTQFALGAVSIVMTVYALWKNHNFTDAAIQAQKEIVSAKHADPLDEIDDVHEMAVEAEAIASAEVTD